MDNNTIYKNLTKNCSSCLFNKVIEDTNSHVCLLFPEPKQSDKMCVFNAYDYWVGLKYNSERALAQK